MTASPTSNLEDKLRDPPGGIFTAHELCRQAADEIERKEPQMSAMRCYVCQSAGDNIASDCREVYLEDDGHKTVYVGPTCFKKVERAGDAGLVSGKGHGPRVFFTFDQAARHAQRSAVEPKAGPGPMPDWARLLLECRDALPAITLAAARLNGLDLKLADRIEAMLEPWKVAPDDPNGI